MDQIKNNGGEENALAKLPEYVTLTEAARLLRCSTKTLRRRIKTGRLRAYRGSMCGSGRFLIQNTELDRYIKSTAVETPFHGA